MNTAGENLVQEGYILYDKGGFLALDLLDGQVFEATVEEDGHLYNVSVVLDKSHKIYRWDCDCQHGFNRFCRHITAVMAAIRDGNYQAHTPIVPSDYRETVFQAEA